MDPPNLSRFLAAHLLAVFGSGLFAATFILATQGVLLSILGERLFRKVLSRCAESFHRRSVDALITISGSLRRSPFRSPVRRIVCILFPSVLVPRHLPRLLEGPSALPIYALLAQTGCMALILVTGLAILAYPFAYLRRSANWSKAQVLDLPGIG